jgi:nucleotide-binding universal stress UspA family protein
VDSAARERAAVVVVGARGRSDARRLLVGSVACGVFQQGVRPVLVVPAPRRARKG